MHFQFIQPSAFLSPYIKHYWVLESDGKGGDVTERVVPTGHVQLMFHYAQPFEVKHPGQSVTMQPQSIVSGIGQTYSDVSTRGWAGVVAVVFHPAGACHFFDFPLSEIENQSLHLKTIFYKEMIETEDRISNAHNMGQRIAAIEGFLKDRFSPIPQYDYLMLNRCLKLITDSKGHIQAATLAKDICMTPKNLERKFAAYLGKTPKQYIKIARFGQTLIDLSRGNPTSFAQYAFENGYFDQSHFIKDFKTFSGYTPRQFAQLKPCSEAETEFGL
jgi:AraC-like DNA-binding protein